MDFITKLRMNNLFTDKNRNPLGPPSSGGNPMEEFQRIYPYIVQEKERDFDHQKQLLEMQQQPPKLQKIGNRILGDDGNQPKQAKPENVVFQSPPISEFQKRSLDLKERDITGDQQVANRRLDLSSKKNEADEAIKKQRADIYEFKAKNPHLEPIRTKGGTVKFLNPVTKEVIDTGIDSGVLSDADEIELKGKQTIAAIDERGKINTGLQDLRGKQNLDAIAARVSGQKDVNNQKADLKQPTPSQNKVSENLKARELANTDPRLGKFIKMDNNGFSIDMPGESGGPTEEEFNAIKSYIYGKDIELPKEKKKAEEPKKSAGPTVISITPVKK